MTPSLPIEAIIFFLASFFLPNDVSQFTANINGNQIQWTKKANSWSAKNLSRHKQLITYRIEGNKVAMSRNSQKKTIDMNEIFNLPARETVKTKHSAKKGLKSVEQFPVTKGSPFGTPVMVSAYKDKLVVNQLRGMIVESDIFIRWK